MCDTLVALADAAARRRVLFAKNSDRERNEAQFLEMTPARRYAAGDAVAATYITLPQAASTHACLLIRPYWMWGAEMGANAHGVVIGNEAMHSTVPGPRRRALTGMDLVRLGLERAASAAAAVAVITELLERHGQGGDCGHLGRFYYHNGFVIADAREAYVLETVGRWWAVEKVVGARALSNAFSIGRDASMVSGDLAAHARATGWCDDEGRFDFAERLIDADRDAVSFGRGRCRRGGALLAAGLGALTATGMMAMLRDHGEAAQGNPRWTPADTVGRTICMHAAQGPRRSQTTGSLVSEIGGPATVHWVTGSAAPCTSLFKPVLFETGLPPQGPRPGDRFDPATRWWRHERLHRAALDDFAARLAGFAPERDRLESSFGERIDQAMAASADPASWRAAVDACWCEADAAEARWLSSWRARAARPAAGAGFRRSWARLNHVAGLPRASLQPKGQPA
jgi:dipeptidase